MTRSYEYQVRNVHGDLLDLSSQRYRTSVPKSSRNYALADRLEQGGSVLLGDGKIKGRKINLKFDYAGGGASRAAQHNDVHQLMNTLASFFRIQDAPFYLENLVRNTRTRVYGDFSPSHVDGNEFLILQTSTIELDVLDAAWEDVTETSSGVVTMASGDTLDLSPALPNYCEDIFPVIEVTARADSPTTFSIETGRDPGTGFVVFRTILLSEATFTLGRVITIDSRNGKILIDGRSAPEIISFGFLVKFDRRNQRLRYYSSTGTGSVDVQIRHRVRTLY